MTRIAKRPRVGSVWRSRGSATCNLYIVTNITPGGGVDITYVCECHLGLRSHRTFAFEDIIVDQLLIDAEEDA